MILVTPLCFSNFLEILDWRKNYSKSPKLGNRKCCQYWDNEMEMLLAMDARLCRDLNFLLKAAHEQKPKRIGQIRTTSKKKENMHLKNYN